MTDQKKNTMTTASVTLKVRKVGSSVGMTLPKKLVDALDVSEGDMLYVTKLEDGIKVSPYNPDVAQQVEMARKIMKKRKSALRELAK